MLVHSSMPATAGTSDLCLMWVEGTPLLKPSAAVLRVPVSMHQVRSQYLNLGTDMGCRHPNLSLRY